MKKLGLRINLGIKFTLCLLGFFSVFVFSYQWLLGKTSIPISLIVLGLFSYFLYYFLIYRKIKRLLKSSFSQQLASNNSSDNDEITLLRKKFSEFSNQINKWQNSFSELVSGTKLLTSKFAQSEIIEHGLNIITKEFPGLANSIILLEDGGYPRLKQLPGQELVKFINFDEQSEIFKQLILDKTALIVNDPDTSSFYQKNLFSEEFNSFLLLPIIVENKGKGLLSLAAWEKNFFSEEKTNYFKYLTQYLGVTLENIKLFSQLQEFNQSLETEISVTTQELTQANTKLIRKIKELKILYDIAMSTTSCFDLTEALNIIIERIKELSGVEYASFMLCDDKNQELFFHLPAFNASAEELKKFTLKMSATGSGRLPEPILEIFTKGETYISADVCRESGLLKQLVEHFRIKSLIILPLTSGSTRLGLFFIANYPQNRFGPEDIRLLTIISGRVAEVIGNIKLYIQIQERVDDLVALKEISSTMSSEPNLEKVLSLISQKTAQALSADFCAFMLYDEKTNELVSHSGLMDSNKNWHISLQESSSRAVRTFCEGKIFVSENIHNDPLALDLSPHFPQFYSMLVVPLRVEKESIGLLYIGSKEKQFFTPEQLRLALLISDESAVIIQNAYLYTRLQEVNRELEQLDKIKNNFISIASHELRTPLTTIKGALSLILDEEVGSVNAQQKHFLGIANHSVNRLDLLISELLDISQIQAGQLILKMGDTSVSSILNQIKENIKEQMAQKNLNFFIESKVDQLPNLQCDPQRISQAIENLISNAIKFTPMGGKIVFSGEDTGEFMILKVSDTGIGISSENQEKIFDKFYQIDSSSTREVGGTGLGLTIVKSIVELHGGRVWVESRLGEGATFYLLLPKTKCNPGSNIGLRTEEAS